MNAYLNAVAVCLLFISTQLLTGCVIVQQQQSSPTGNIEVTLNQFKQSDFKQVEAIFSTYQSKELVFRVLSDIDKTPQWLARLDRLEVLEVYNNHQYLLRTIIKSPWPFQNRELITCVDTLFEERITTISVTSCSERLPVSDLYVRLLHVESSWTITQKTDSLVEVHYKAWIDPSGNVPAFIFNNELIDNTTIDLERLQAMIEDASLGQYPY